MFHNLQHIRQIDFPGCTKAFFINFISIKLRYHEENFILYPFDCRFDLIL
jgi:hypothetical protein